ncbi:hypothetical protein C2E15_17055 [Mixta gaviniae]|uniref:Uncharacterized protein n=1 Tax=Mixta gaviniae TaxID=665914 RepID=A0A2L0IJ65_9GAMM|nr:hypothetical protein C2E15_17055 [Mixta gaviniae]
MIPVRGITLFCGFSRSFTMFCTKLSTEKVNKIACFGRSLFITMMKSVSYPNVMRYAQPQAVVYRL